MSPIIDKQLSLLMENGTGQNDVVSWFKTRSGEIGHFDGITDASNSGQINIKEQYLSVSTRSD